MRVPVPAASRPSSRPTSRPARQRLARLPFATVLAATLALAALGPGCMGGGGPVARLDAGEAEAVARAAWQELPRQLAGADPQVRGLEGELKLLGAGLAPPAPGEGPSDADTPAPADGWAGLAGLLVGPEAMAEFRDLRTIRFDLEWGREASARLEAELAGPGKHFEVVLTCTDAGEALRFGSATYISRPTQGADRCSGAVADPIGGFTDRAPAQLGAAAVMPGKGSEQVVTFMPPSDTISLGREDDQAPAIAIHVDGKRHVTQFALSSPAANLTLRLDEGSRRAIALPEEGERMPADIVFDFALTGEGRGTGTVIASPNRPALGDLELRLLDDGVVVAAFPLDQPGMEGGGAVEFAVVDADRDARLGEGDRFMLEGMPAGTTVQLYDTWAGRAVGDPPIPGVSAGLMLAGVAGLAAAAWRRGNPRS